ncbi:MAG: tetratricopeptide repeat protein [Clostridium sp.]|uniref:tetratricopeptide repeat protein n=1 Tax=Clostridium sp. TaxID=1506 RepID=UPI0025BCB401|nr:tetratricopeptide repeat protein [Clostridium sp.]MCH3963288.1 tetratricopeptide repeat protein [Clostridium sp.]MCI1717327.1 tetratricopeptide repeat protein [Clostridium sp.]MCI1801667.1 tetratricopeptide repeat protein [Clostridium sp.]MCI1815513.1 tetratricopeptide repeat protein [Clostridium sp.]MCI1872416.1 tetratricopeptide repeat protein [Clostridium sp.]
MINLFRNFKKRETYTENAVVEFNNTLKDLYDNFSSRIDIKRWNMLIDDSISKLGIKTSSNELLNFLTDNRNLPYKVWILFNKYFKWSTRSEELSSAFSKTFIQFVLSNINFQYKLRYDLFEENINGSYDDFINLYYEAYFALKNKNLYTCQKSILEAKEIFPKHLDLIILEGRYYSEVNNIKMSLDKLSYAIGLDNEDFEAHLYRAHVYVRIGKLEHAYGDYKKCLELSSDSTDVQYGLADCCLHMGKYEESKNIYNKIRVKYPDSETIISNLDSASSFSSDKDYTEQGKF